MDSDSDNGKESGNVVSMIGNWFDKPLMRKFTVQADSENKCDLLRLSKLDLSRMYIQFHENYSDLFNESDKQLKKICVIKLHALKRTQSLVEEGQMEAKKILENVLTNQQINEMSYQEVTEYTKLEDLEYQRSQTPQTNLIMHQNEKGR